MELRFKRLYSISSFNNVEYEITYEVPLETSLQSSITEVELVKKTFYLMGLLADQSLQDYLEQHKKSLKEGVTLDTNRERLAQESEATRIEIKKLLNGVKEDVTTF